MERGIGPWICRQCGKRYWFQESRDHCQHIPQGSGFNRAKWTVADHAFPPREEESYSALTAGL